MSELKPGEHESQFSKDYRQDRELEAVGEFVDLSLLSNKAIIDRLKELQAETDRLIRECRLRGGKIIIEAAKL